MSKLGFLAVLLSAVWLTLAAMNSDIADEPTFNDPEELQGLELEHLQNGADPASWGRILEAHAVNMEDAE